MILQEIKKMRTQIYLMSGYTLVSGLINADIVKKHSTDGKLGKGMKLGIRKKRRR